MDFPPVPNGLWECRACLLAAARHMEVYVPEDWQLVDDDGLYYWRLKRDIASSSTGAEDEELLFPPEMLTKASKSALQRKKEMLLAKKASYAADIKQWEELLELAAQDFPAVPDTLESRPLAASTILFPELYQKLLSEVEKLEDCVQVGNHLILRLEGQINVQAHRSFYHELQLTTPVLSARKIQRDLLEPSSGGR